MIVNFRPSNLGLFGFPLQAHARKKKIVQSWWSRLGEDLVLSSAMHSDPTQISDELTMSLGVEGFESGCEGREDFGGQAPFCLKGARVRRSSIRWWTFETRMT